MSFEEWLVMLGKRFGTDKFGGPSHHYEHAYRFVEQIQFQPITLLEIGVLGGASLKLWREILPNAKIVGVDKNEKCRSLEWGRVSIETGDQSDEAFLSEIVRKHGPFDIVIDDGSHVAAHQLASMRGLWPHAKRFYVIEDLQHPPAAETARQMGNEVRRLLKARLPDDIAAIHCYPSIVVLEKACASPF
ncbi:Mycinamicin VI 2''-O-methyltransferase [Planctomycetes bacterium Pan216]|uniref:Mycinamicin VI 2''-O-methyltransferase n=1 Tax=Kolteria novifilia TaxID=2527975 RepID=A0A518AZ47_9BACT|nr:Mycinamicin VI 2''-O-methyltransferase [Planctomycetes bacterium Pan216]